MSAKDLIADPNVRGGPQLQFSRGFSTDWFFSYLSNIFRIFHRVFGFFLGLPVTRAAVATTYSIPARGGAGGPGQWAAQNGLIVAEAPEVMKRGTP